MIYSIIYFILAALGIGVLIFIHELGHYLVARKEGMKIEAFSVGFGKPIFSWEKDGVKWQVCWIPIGGYVRIAGMEKKGVLEPYQIENGFFGKSPWARIRVALAGPVVNILFAAVLFCCVWALGGREKPFAHYTHLIGWVEPRSDLFKIGVRAGDEISVFRGQPFQGFTQFQTSAFLDKGTQEIKGYELNYETQSKTPFTYALNAGANVKGQEKLRAIAAMLSPASYLIYSSGTVMQDSPLRSSGINEGDRILWVDGELIFSRRQLTNLVNQPRVLLIVERQGRQFLTRVPRLQIEDLRLKTTEKEELHDWAYAKQIKGEPGSLYFIPYDLTNKGKVESAVTYIDENAVEQKMFSKGISPLEIPLESGDVILSVDGRPVKSGEDILEALQTRNIQVIVQRGESYAPISWKEADAAFMQNVSFTDLHKLVESIGSSSRLACMGNLCLLSPVAPKPWSSLFFTASVQKKVEKTIEAQRKQVEEISNPQEKEMALRALESEQNRLMIGGVFEDRIVDYNPAPWTLAFSVFDDMKRTLSALFTGYLSPKYMAGPVGIVGVMQQGWGLGLKEALFWMAVISLNLGLINLMPIPVLDGGHICFSLYELITKKRIKAKTMEKMIIPFIALIIVFFLYATYHDILRLFSSSF